MGIMKTLTINGTTYEIASVVPKSSVTLLADRWVRDGDAHSQVVEVAGVTPRSKVDLQPTREQLEEFHHKVLAFVTENDNGEVKAYAIGDKPSGDHTMQVTLTEVEGSGKVRGNTVGTTMPRSNFLQTDPTKADYIIGRENIPAKNELQSAIEEAIQQANESGIHIGSDEPTDGSEVWIDTDEEAPESDGGGASINVTAEVGQTIIVKAVDTNGKPTEWESADYQPRTHWSEWVELLPETNAVIDENEGMFFIPVDFVFKVGETYKIKYNGDEYVRTAFGFTDAGVTLAIVGNGVALDLDDTGEPFTMFIQDGVLMGLPLDGSAEGTVAIYGNEYHTIPQSYLPQPVHWIDAVEVDGAYEQITVTPAQTTAAIDAGLDVRLRIHAEGATQDAENVYILPCVTYVRLGGAYQTVWQLVFNGKVGIFPQERLIHLTCNASSGSENLDEAINLPWVLLND